MPWITGPASENNASSAVDHDRIEPSHGNEAIKTCLETEAKNDFEAAVLDDA